MMQETTGSPLLLDNPKDISKKRDLTLSQYQAYKDAICARRIELVGILRLQQFYRDANELERWINERMQRASEESWKSAANLEVCLQKHATLEAEVHANQGSLNKLQSEGEELIADDHHSKEIIKTRLLEINALWEKLLEALKIQGTSLNLAHELSLYLHWCDEVLYWIKDKESLITGAELGHDLEHVKILQAKHDELLSELQGYGERVKEVNEKAYRMVEVDGHDVVVITSKQNEVKDKWEHLNNLAKERKQALATAYLVHKFKKDAEEVISWMKEKEMMMHSDELGSDVASVQKLQRDHESIAYDLLALKDKVDNLSKVAEMIEQEHEGVSVDAEKEEILENWARLNRVAEQRKNALEKHHQLHHFLSEWQDLVDWCKLMEARLTADELASDLASAEVLVDKHQEHMGEINAREDNFAEVVTLGKRLLEDHKTSRRMARDRDSKSSSSSSSSSSSDSESDTESPGDTVLKCLTMLENYREHLLQILDERHALYDQCLHLALFNRDAEQAESWMTAQEALLTQKDTGDSLDAVLTSKRKHDDFIKSAKAQEEKINSVDEVASRLIASNHYAADDIGKRRDELLSRHAALKEGISARQAELNDAYKLYSFMRNVNNLCSWIEEKMAIASDEAYKDETNALGKFQRHRLFEEEVRASKERVQACKDEAQSLIDSNHYASDDVQKEMARAEEMWEKLQKQCLERGNKLSDACKEQAFNRSVADIDRWISEVENALSSDDIGKDVATVTSLIKKHQVLEVEVQIHKERVDGIEIQANKFVEDEHFNCEAIKQKQLNLSERYKRLQEPITQRRDKLAASLLSKQLFRDIQDEVEWVEEKQPIVDSTNIGKDWMSAKNLLRKHELVQSEISAHEPQIDSVVSQANKLVEEGHIESKKADTLSDGLVHAWKKLGADAEQRQEDLQNSVAAQNYLAAANDAQSWIAEQQAILQSEDVGVDEDSAESLIKKNKALMQDVDRFGQTVEDLREEAKQCKLQCPWEREESIRKVLVIHDFNGKSTRELTVKKGEVLPLISTHNKDLWKVGDAERNGIVPSACLHVVTDEELKEEEEESDAEETILPQRTLLTRQQELEEAYDKLKDSCLARDKVLQLSRRQHALSRESDDLLKWVENRTAVVNSYDVQGDEDGGLDRVQDLQKKLDEFQKDVKAREKRIAELNEESEDLGVDQVDGVSEDGREPVVERVQKLNTAWGSLHQAVTDQNSKLGSAHQVQGFFRDAEETYNWIEEKNVVLQNENVGNDLSTVQALQRKHEGLERDLAALGEHVYSLDAKATKLSDQYPDQSEAIQAKQSQINQAWNDLVAKAEKRKHSLSSCHELQRFLTDCKELQLWLTHMDELCSRDDVADDIAGAESLLQRHQDYRADIDARAPSYHLLQRQADALIGADHPSAKEIDSSIQEVSNSVEKLEKSWADRRILLEQCLALHHFLRECDAADSWMEAREAFLSSDQSGDSLNSVESLIKKHEDFNRAIGLQEAKIMAIQATSEHLLASTPSHYAEDCIRDKAEKVLERWENLKVALIDKRSRLGETQSLQQFSRDADEANAWINEKLQTTLDESYKDPANIQSKHQKHQAFEAELDANKERIQAIMDAGRQLIDSHQCAGSEDAVQSRINQLENDWNNLVSKSHEKAEKLKEANQQQDFIMAVKDLEMWMAEVEAVLGSEDVGKDVRSVSNLLKKQKLLEADIAAHEDRAKELSDNADALLQKSNDSDALDPEAVQQKQEKIEERFAVLKDLAKKRRGKLQESLVSHQLLYDIADEQAWINEKKILVSSDDTGKDLMGVQKLKKKHKRIEAEIGSHEPNVDRILTRGKELLEKRTVCYDEIEQRLDELENNWSQLKELAVDRRKQLLQAQAYHRFKAELDEESGWMADQLHVMEAFEEPQSLPAAQSMLAKHEAFKIDLNVHEQRLADVKDAGERLISEENPRMQDVASDLKRVDEQMEKLEAASSKLWNLLSDTSAFLQFNWKADVVESSIKEKEHMLTSEKFDDDLSLVQALLLKQATFDAGLQAFEQEGIANITSLKDQLVASGHAQRDAIQKRHSILMEKWDGLKAASKERKDLLEETQSRLRGINDLYLSFAKKASAFNSWFENVEEDMSDPVRCHSVVEIQALIKEHKAFCETLGEAESELEELFAIDNQLIALSPEHSQLVNPYTWFTRQNLEETWNNMKEMVREREAELQRELGRQQDNDVARQKFAKEANLFYDWLTSTRASMVAESGSLEEQLEAMKLKSKEVKERKDKLKGIEQLGAALEEALILDNVYTEHSTVGLAQQWDQLEQLGMRMQHNLEQQIQARNMTGVAEDALKEFSMMFKHFDKDKTGRLDHHEFKSCLRSLGYDLPIVDEGESEPEFEAILDMVDPNRDGEVSLQEYMGFMISRETENVQSTEEVESAFQALSTEGKPYVTREELYQNLSREQADYCIANMPPYYDAHGISVLGAYDYVAFTRQLFNN